MHALVELIASLIAAVVVAVFGSFGIDLQPSQAARDDREVRRTDQREPARKTDASFVQSTRDC